MHDDGAEDGDELADLEETRAGAIVLGVTAAAHDIDRLFLQKDWLISFPVLRRIARARLRSEKEIWSLVQCTIFWADRQPGESFTVLYSFISNYGKTLDSLLD